MRARLALIVAALLSTSGCYRMTITNGRPPEPSPKVDQRWASATVLDVFPVDSPTRLDLTCKETGWSEIHQHQSVLNWLVDAFLAGKGIYESTQVDIYCAHGGQAAPASQPAPAPTPQPEPTPQPAPTPETNPSPQPGDTKL